MLQMQEHGVLHMCDMLNWYPVRTCWVQGDASKMRCVFVALMHVQTCRAADWLSHASMMTKLGVKHKHRPAAVCHARGRPEPPELPQTLTSLRSSWHDALSQQTCKHSSGRPCSCRLLLSLSCGEFCDARPHSWMLFHSKLARTAVAAAVAAAAPFLKRLRRRCGRVKVAEKTIVCSRFCFLGWLGCSSALSSAASLAVGESSGPGEPCW